MPVIKRRLRTRRRDDLSWAELWDLLLARRWHRGSPFESPFLRKAAWLAHREELLEDVGLGCRPGAWWEYEAPGQPLSLGDGAEETELAALIRLGVATPAEKRLFLRMFHLSFPEDPEEREQLFKFQPEYRVRYEHERKLIEKLEDGGHAKT